MSRQPFNADDRSKGRESTPTIVGGKQFFPVRLTNKVMRAVRSLAHEADPIQRELSEAERRVESLQLQVARENGKPEDSRDFDALDRLRSELVEAEDVIGPITDRQQDASGEMLFRQLRLLLVDENAQPADPEFLSEHLDTRDAGPLMEWLMQAGEDEGNAETPEGTRTATSA